MTDIMASFQLPYLYLPTTFERMDSSPVYQTGLNKKYYAITSGKTHPFKVYSLEF
jgi:hypothetical protein